MVLKIENKEIVKGLGEFRSITNNDIYMEMLVNALAKVSPKYICSETSLHSESTYVTELCHQWRMLIDNNNPNELCLNTEPSKYLNVVNVYRRKEPDVILHREQSNCDDNRIACEIKRKNWANEGFEKDMDTLNSLLTTAKPGSKLYQNFQWGVFIQIGGTIDRLKNYIKRNSFNNDIWCIVVNDDVTQLTIETIGNIKNEI